MARREKGKRGRKRIENRGKKREWRVRKKENRKGGERRGYTEIRGTREGGGEEEKVGREEER